MRLLLLPAPMTITFIGLECGGIVGGCLMGVRAWCLNCTANESDGMSQIKLKKMQ